jgi:hypothetical protein
VDESGVLKGEAMARDEFNIEDTGNKDWEKDYTKSDVEVLFNRGEWKDWDDAITWLKREGDQDNELTPGEVVSMTRDLERLKDEGTRFTRDPQRVYEMAHERRS